MDIKILFKTVGVVFGKRGIDFNKPDALTKTQAPVKAEEAPQKSTDTQNV